MKIFKIIIALLIHSQISVAYEIICPKIPYTAISIEIIPKVSFNKKTSLYKYQYTFKNNASSQLPLGTVRMMTYQNVQSVKTPSVQWDLDYQDFSNEILWGANVGFDDSVVLPGKSLSGFEFESPSPPGPIKYAVAGWKSILIRSNSPKIIYTEAERGKYAHDEIQTNCPGEDFEDRMPEIIGITTGPTPPNTINAKLRLKKLKDKKWHGRHDDDPKLEMSPLDVGKVQLMLFDDKNVDVSKVDLSSIKFGPGNATPIKTEFTQYVDDEKDSEIVEHLKKHNKRHLLMEFNITDLKIECDIDRALFFSAKMEDKKLSGAVKIKHAICSEVHKIKKDRAKKNRPDKKKEDASDH